MLLIENTLLLVIDVQDRMMAAIRNREELESGIATLVRSCRILGLPIMTMQQYTKGLGDSVALIKDALGEFEPVEKISFSCYGADEFVSKLTGHNRKNVLVSGVEAHVCVQQTVLDLLANGYSAYLIADCIGSRKAADLEYAEKRMQQAGAIVTTMESALFEMVKTADHPLRKDITGLIK